MKNELERVARSLGVYDKLEDLGLESPDAILSKLPIEIQQLLKLDEKSNTQLVDAAANQIYDWRLREKVGEELMGKTGPAFLTTGDTIMDDLLGQGIPLETITEIVGESSSGKTQLALQLCLTVQRPIQEGGLGGAAVYIHSEGPFPSQRLDQMINHQTMSENDKKKAKEQIHTDYVKDSDQQYRTIAYKLPAFLESRKNIRLIVIDSISAVYRGEALPADKKAKFEKMSEICDIGTRLKQIAAKYRVAIVVLNQVSDVPVTGNGVPTKLVENWLDFELISYVKKGAPSPLGIYIQSLTKRPVLGLSWSNSVTTRLRLARSPMIDGLVTRRAFFVEFSPFVPRMGCEFNICDSGIHSVEEESLEQ